MPANLKNRKRKFRSPKNNPLNPKYAILRAKMEKKREARNQRRIALGRNPISNPLTMVVGGEQRKAYMDGKLLLKNGDKLIKIPLVTKVPLAKAERVRGDEGRLQGVYKLPGGNLAVLRTSTLFGKPVLRYFIRLEAGETPTNSYFDRLTVIDHLNLGETSLKGRGLELKALSRTEKEFRSTRPKQPFFVSDTQVPLFEKMHYKSSEGSKNSMSKVKPFYARENIQTHHVIEAINPVTGKIKIYPIKIKSTL